MFDCIKAEHVQVMGLSYGIVDWPDTEGFRLADPIDIDPIDGTLDVAPASTYQPLHFALVVTFGGRPEFVVKQVIALRLSKDLNPSPLAIAQYLRHTAIRRCAPPYGAVSHGLACWLPEWCR